MYLHGASPLSETNAKGLWSGNEQDTQHDFTYMGQASLSKATALPEQEILELSQIDLVLQNLQFDGTIQPDTLLVKDFHNETRGRDPVVQVIPPTLPAEGHQRQKRQELNQEDEVLKKRKYMQTANDLAAQEALAYYLLNIG